MLNDYYCTANSTGCAYKFFEFSFTVANSRFELVSWLLPMVKAKKCKKCWPIFTLK